MIFGLPEELESSLPNSSPLALMLSVKFERGTFWHALCLCGLVWLWQLSFLRPPGTAQIGSTAQRRRATTTQGLKGLRRARTHAARFAGTCTYGSQSTLGLGGLRDPSVEMRTLLGTHLMITPGPAKSVNPSLYPSNRNPIL